MAVPKPQELRMYIRVGMAVCRYVCKVGHTKCMQAMLPILVSFFAAIHCFNMVPQSSQFRLLEFKKILGWVHVLVYFLCPVLLTCILPSLHQVPVVLGIAIQASFCIFVLHVQVCNIRNCSNTRTTGQYSRISMKK